MLGIKSRGQRVLTSFDFGIWMVQYLLNESFTLQNSNFICFLPDHGANSNPPLSSTF